MLGVCISTLLCCLFKQKTAYEMRISDWSSDVCSSDLRGRHCPAVFHPHSPLRDELQGKRIEPVLHRQYAGGERIGVIACRDGHGRLRDDRSLVHALGDEMDGAAGDLHTRVEGALLGM